MNDGGLTPKQHEILYKFLGKDDERPRFLSGLAPRLKTMMEEGFRSIASSYESRRGLFMSKWKFVTAQKCEGTMFEEEDFEWSLQSVRGKIAHAAIDKMIMSQYARPPTEVTERTLDRLSHEEHPSELAGFLSSLSEDDRLYLLREAGDAVTKFCMDWPRIHREWRPRAESVIYQDFCEGRITCQGRIDLAIGWPRGNVAGTVIIDLKTGQAQGDHTDHLRFYALLETLARGTPPYRIGTYYLDSGTYTFEDVQERMIEETAQRAIEAGTKMARADVASSLEELSLSPGWHCGRCASQKNCELGTEWLKIIEAAEHG